MKLSSSNSVSLSFLVSSLWMDLSAAFSIPSYQQRAATATALQASPFANDVGATPPLGVFDPLRFTEDMDDASFDHYREVELRHGRVGMLAVAGWLVTAGGIRLPGMEGMPFGFKALYQVQDLPPHVRGTLPLTLGTVWFLTFVMDDLEGTAEFPGDYRNGVVDFGWDKQTDEWKQSKRAIELNNGRGAMIGILGIMVHEQLGNLNDVGLPQP